MTGAAEKDKQGQDDENRRIEHHLVQVPTLKGLVVDKKATDGLKDYAHTFFKILGAKHLFGNEQLPADPKAEKMIAQLQKNWGTGPDSFPAIIFLPRGTEEFKVDWAMVNPDDFKRTPDELLEFVKRANEVHNVDRVRSLEFVYTIMKGERPPGSKDQNPLPALPGKSRF